MNFGVETAGPQTLDNHTLLFRFCRWDDAFHSFRNPAVSQQFIHIDPMPLWPITAEAGRSWFIRHGLATDRGHNWHDCGSPMKVWISHMQLQYAF